MSQCLPSCCIIIHFCLLAKNRNFYRTFILVEVSVFHFVQKGNVWRKAWRKRPSFQFPLPLSIHHWAMPKGKTTQHSIDIIDLWRKSEESDGSVMKDWMIKQVKYHIKWPYIISIHPSIHPTNTYKKKWKKKTIKDGGEKKGGKDTL